MSSLPELLKKDIADGVLPKNIGDTILSFHDSYMEALANHPQLAAEATKTLLSFREVVIEELAYPFVFQNYHPAERIPFDYYKLGLDLFRPLIIFEESKVLGHENLVNVEHQLQQKHNVIFFANHQAEPDPQAISLLLESKYPTIAESTAYVAGHRVVSDPLAKPFSRGRNLFCIYSKRHIENPPEHKELKLRHNQKTLNVMTGMLEAGGVCIYVAPSGGRDRPGPEGIPMLAPFDAQSIEMFLLLARKAETPTHFYPLSLSTFKLLPPPDTVLMELGEKRHANRTPIHLNLGKELDLENFPGNESADKKERRQYRATHIWNLVRQGYQQLL